MTSTIKALASYLGKPASVMLVAPPFVSWVSEKSVNADEEGYSLDYIFPQNGLEVRVRADAQFREWVLYTQPNRPSLCIEPYTCVPNAINAEAEGIPDAGLKVLEAGERWEARVVIEAGISR